LLPRDQAREQFKGNQTAALASHGLGRPLLAHIKHTRSGWRRCCWTFCLVEQAISFCLVDSLPHRLRFFTVHNTSEQSYGGIVGFVLWVKW
jgi:hypothetical protein